MAALAFKVRLDKGRREVLARVFSGKLERSSRLVNTRTGQRERVAQLLRPHAGKREPCDGAGPGDIVIIKGLRSVGTGDTIADAAAPILLEPIDARPALVSLAVEPRSSRDQDALELALQQAAEEDPTFHVRQDEESGQTIVSGVGELHLEIVLQHVRDAHGLEFRAGRPDVVYRETVAAAGEGRGALQPDDRGAASSRRGHVPRAAPPARRAKHVRRRPGRSGGDATGARRRGAVGSARRRADRTRRLSPPGRRGDADRDGADGDVKNDVAARVAAAIAAASGRRGCGADPPRAHDGRRAGAAAGKSRDGDRRADRATRPRPRRRRGGRAVHRSRRRAARDDVRLREPAGLAHVGPRRAPAVVPRLRASARVNRRHRCGCRIGPRHPPVGRSAPSPDVSRTSRRGRRCRIPPPETARPAQVQREPAKFHTSRRAGKANADDRFGNPSTRATAAPFVR